jgi:hypothetical protein
MDWLLPLALALRWAEADGFEVMGCAGAATATAAADDDDDDVNAANFAERR